MPTFAQTYDDLAVNIVIGETFDAAVAGVFSPEWVKNQIDLGHDWVVVPDGTLTFAKPDGQGGWTNPTPPAVEPPPVALTKTQFQALYSANGSDLTATLDAWPEG